MSSPNPLMPGLLPVGCGAQLLGVSSEAELLLLGSTAIRSAIIAWRRTEHNLDRVRNKLGEYLNTRLFAPRTRMSKATVQELERWGFSDPELIARLQGDDLALAVKFVRSTQTSLSDAKEKIRLKTKQLRILERRATLPHLMLPADRVQLPAQKNVHYRNGDLIVVRAQHPEQLDSAIPISARGAVWLTGKAVVDSTSTRLQLQVQDPSRRLTYLGNPLAPNCMLPSELAYLRQHPQYAYHWTHAWPADDDYDPEELYAAIQR